MTKKLKLKSLKGEEAKQAIKDYETILFEDFAKKYDVDMVMKAGRIIDELKKKVGDKK